MAFRATSSLRLLRYGRDKDPFTKARSKISCHPFSRCVVKVGWRFSAQPERDQTNALPWCSGRLNVSTTTTRRFLAETLSHNNKSWCQASDNDDKSHSPGSESGLFVFPLTAVISSRSDSCDPAGAVARQRRRTQLRNKIESLNEDQSFDRCISCEKGC